MADQKRCSVRGRAARMCTRYRSKVLDCRRRYAEKERSCGIDSLFVPDEVSFVFEETGDKYSSRKLQPTGWMPYKSPRTPVQSGYECVQDHIPSVEMLQPSRGPLMSFSPKRLPKDDGGFAGKHRRTGHGQRIGCAPISAFWARRSNAATRDTTDAEIAALTREA